MILLEVQNRIIAEAIRGRLIPLGPDEKPEPIELTVADFDGALYHISNVDGDATKIRISLGLKFYHELKPHGVDDLMKREYGALLVDAEPNYDVTVVVDLTAIAADPEPTIAKVACLRRHAFAAVFEKFFNLQQSGTPSAQQALIHYRDRETMYVAAHKDRVTVVFSTLFSDADDIVIGKVFLQEFKEGRRGNQQAPQVLFSHKDPPAELSDSSALTGENVGYVTFVLFPRHFEGAQRNSTIDLIHTFRDYLHYHIKCSKAYLHQRMRSRTSELLKVLNRARPEVEREKRTATGRFLKSSVTGRVNASGKPE